MVKLFINLFSIKLTSCSKTVASSILHRFNTEILILFVQSKGKKKKVCISYNFHNMGSVSLYIILNKWCAKLSLYALNNIAHRYGCLPIGSWTWSAKWCPTNQTRCHMTCMCKVCTRKYQTVFHVLLKGMSYTYKQSSI